MMDPGVPMTTWSTMGGMRLDAAERWELLLALAAAVVAHVMRVWVPIFWST
jgi:hypothetical protein